MNQSINLHPGNFFQRLPVQDQMDLIALGTRKNLPKDQRLLHAGKVADDVTIVLEGRVKVSELSPEGREVILWFCFAGELVGMSEMLSGGARGLNALTCSPCEVLCVKQSEFEQFILQHPMAVKGIIDVLNYRLREISDVFLILTTGDVTTRVCQLLGRLSARYGSRCEASVRIDIPLTHQEMADMIGTSRQSVTTVLGILKRQGKIRVEQRTLYVQDLAWMDGVIAAVSSSQDVLANRNSKASTSARTTTASATARGDKAESSQREAAYRASPDQSAADQVTASTAPAAPKVRSPGIPVTR